MSYLMIGLQSTELNADETKNLRHPMVGGVILFSRNYQDRDQLQQLVRSIRVIRDDILIAVDHEGGRVQRFIDGFSKIPAMGDVFPKSGNDMSLAKRWLTELGFLMAIELLSCDIDLSFAPVLDVDGISEVIGNRGFSASAEECSLLAESFIDGMASAGMSAVGKHFPGHGSVSADSHIARPIDTRDEKVIRELDMLPFKNLIAKQKLQGIMPSHVIYNKVDPDPAGFSRYWIKTILRDELKFDGVIFSDDIGMVAAGSAGDYSRRLQAAIDAGCDMVLLCNDHLGITKLLTHFDWPQEPPQVSANLLRANTAQLAIALEQESRWIEAKAIANKLI